MHRREDVFGEVNRRVRRPPTEAARAETTPLAAEPDEALVSAAQTRGGLRYLDAFVERRTLAGAAMKTSMFGMPVLK